MLNIIRLHYFIMIMKEGNEPNLEEFKFIYKLDGAINLDTKYFMANETDDAKKMFSFVCKKNDLVSTVHRIEKWNRWSSKWEVQYKEDS